MALGAVVSERHVVQVALEESQRQLENRVRQKTAALEEEVGARKLAEQNLQQSYGQLEERVQARTAELGRLTEDFRRSEQRLQAIIDNSTAIIYVKDCEGRYLLVNREWELSNKMDRSKAIGHKAHEIYPAEFAEKLAANDRRVIESKEGIQFEETVPHPVRKMVSYISNKFPLLDAAGNCYAIGGISTDITQRKRDEQAVLESEARKAAILESALDCVVTMDARGMIMEWNPAAERTFGYSKAEAIGREMAELIIPPSFRERHRSGIARYLETGEGPILNKRIELTALRKDGVEFPVEVAVTRVPLGGDPIFTGYLRDITERKQIQERELRAKETAEAANRAKDEFLAVVSHELRTPLTPILGWTRIMRTYPADAQQNARALEVIERNVRAQGRLVEDLLDISRIVTGKLRLDMQPVSLRSVVQAALDTVRVPLEARHLVLELELGQAIAPMVGDPDRLQQVVWNLLTNAIKFTPAGGRIRVELRETKDQIELTVTDSGQGISPEYLPQMFNRFSQADSKTTRRYGGLGLGLAIVRHIVEMHGGNVKASSDGKDKGATFTVLFPIAIPSAPAGGSGEMKPRYGTPLHGMAAVPTLKGVKVLAVDDERDTLEFVRAALQLWGAEVVTFGSAVEALGKFDEIRPDIVISDLAMPDIDGYGLIARLRSLPPDRGGNTPAIAVTAYARVEDHKRLLAAGYQKHIAKPIDPGDLVNAVSNVLGLQTTPQST
jgi:PAS domain S-box-containing protein